MTRLFSYLIICVLLLASCRKEQVRDVAGGVPVSFVAADDWGGAFGGGRAAGYGPVTKAVSFQGDDFGVYSYFHPVSGASGEFMSNQRVFRDSGDAPWEYHPLKYWPAASGDALSFYAYAPHTSVSSGTDVMIPLDGSDDVMWARAVRTVGAAADELAPGTEISCAEGRDGVGFVFRHLLMKISFVFVKGDGFGDGRYVEKLN